MKKMGFLESEVRGISNDVFNDVSSDTFDVSSDVPGSIWNRFLLACVPTVYRYSAVCVHGCIDIFVKASGALRSVVLGIPKKLSAVYGLCSCKVSHRVYAMCGSVRHFFQVVHKALRDSFVDNPEYDAFGV